MFRSHRALVAAVVTLGAAVPAHAQTMTQAPLAGLLLNFFSPSNPVVLQANPVPQFSHAAHFMSQPGAQATLRELNSGIASQLSTFPIGSSSQQSSRQGRCQATLFPGQGLSIDLVVAYSAGP